MANHFRLRFGGYVAAATLLGCNGLQHPIPAPNAGWSSHDNKVSAATRYAQGDRYLPLAIGDYWKYTCRDVKGGGENNGKPFSIYHRVVGSTSVGTHRVYEFYLEIPQVPSRPLKIVTEIMLLNNDTNGNLWLYGYLVHHVVRKISAAKIVSNATPRGGTKFDYTGPTGKPVSRIFCCIEQTNRTPLGIFTVADYEESANTHDYGYARGTGIAEEDHGPNYEVDCLIKTLKLN